MMTDRLIREPRRPFSVYSDEEVATFEVIISEMQEYPRFNHDNRHGVPDTASGREKLFEYIMLSESHGTYLLAQIYAKAESSF